MLFCATKLLAVNAAKLAAVELTTVPTLATASGVEAVLRGRLEVVFGVGDFFEPCADCERSRTDDEPIDEDQARALPLTSIQRLWSIAPTAIPDLNPFRRLAKMSPEIRSNFGSHFECQ